MPGGNKIILAQTIIWLQTFKTDDDQSFESTNYLVFSYVYCCWCLLSTAYLLKDFSVSCVILSLTHFSTDTHDSLTRESTGLRRGPPDSSITQSQSPSFADIVINFRSQFYKSIKFRPCKLFRRLAFVFILRPQSLQDLRVPPKIFQILIVRILI